jgi:Fe-S cluster biosynthesis and repair protein YggX
VPRMVQCVVLKREAPGFDRPFYPGELGRRIYDGVSREGWARWMQHQTMLINEYRLTPIEPKARKFLEAEMEKFLFGGGSSKPEGYKAPGTEE